MGAVDNGRSRIRRGSHGTRLSVTPTPIRMIASPNTVLTPGIDTGSRKGRVRKTHTSSIPCSPISSSKSRNDTLPAGSEPDTPSNVVDSLLAASWNSTLATS